MPTDWLRDEGGIMTSPQEYSSLGLRRSEFETLRVVPGIAIGGAEGQD